MDKSNQNVFFLSLQRMGLFLLATVLLCLDGGLTQMLRPGQLRFGGPRRFPIRPRPAPVRFPGAPFPGPLPPNRPPNFVVRPPTPRRQIFFPGAANSRTSNVPTSSPFLSGSVSGSNFGSVNSQSQNLMTDPSVTVDVGNLDFGSVAEAVMSNMFSDSTRGSATLTNNNNVNRNGQAINQGQANSLLASVNIASQLDNSNIMQNDPLSTNWNANVESQAPIGAGLRPVQMLNGESRLTGGSNTLNINFGTGNVQNSISGGLVGSPDPLTQQNATNSVTLSPAFPGFSPLELPEMGEDSWFSYLKGLLDRTNSNLQIFSNSTGGGMFPIPQRITDVPRGTMPIYIQNFRSNPAYVPFRLPGQPFNMLIPFNRDNREMMYPYLPIYIPYPNVGIDLPETGQRFVAYLPFQPDRYKASIEGAGVVFPQVSSPGSFPVYVDRRPAVGNLMQQVRTCTSFCSWYGLYVGTVVKNVPDIYK